MAVLDRDPEAAQRTVKIIERDGGEAMPVIADVTSDRSCAEAVAAVVERWGTLDALVNNVASGDRAGLFEVTPKRFDELMTINLKSAWLMTRHAVPVMPRGSAIVNISSVGVVARGPGMVYNLAKSGVENMTEGAATTLGPQGIRVNCVRVGAIWGSFAAANMDERMREPRRKMNALQQRAPPGTSPTPPSTCSATAPAGCPATSSPWRAARRTARSSRSPRCRRRRSNPPAGRRPGRRRAVSRARRSRCRPAGRPGTARRARHRPQARGRGAGNVRYRASWPVLGP